MEHLLCAKCHGLWLYYFHQSSEMGITNSNWLMSLYKCFGSQSGQNHSYEVPGSKPLVVDTRGMRCHNPHITDGEAGVQDFVRTRPVTIRDRAKAGTPMSLIPNLGSFQRQEATNVLEGCSPTLTSTLSPGSCKVPYMCIHASVFTEPCLKIFVKKGTRRRQVLVVRRQQNCTGNCLLCS